MEIIGFSKFVGIEQIQLFWSALVFDLKSEIAYRDVNMEFLSDDAMSLSANLTASGHSFIGVAMNESWVRNKGSWRISGCRLQVRSASVAAIESFLVFVQIFSTSLHHWLNGQDVTEDNWSRIADACANELGVVLPDGRKISGVELLALIRDLVASEPSLVMEVSQLEMLTMSESLCVVTYVESRRLSGEVGTEDVRSTLAFARHSSAGWAWRHVQQTSTELR